MPSFALLFVELGNSMTRIIAWAFRAAKGRLKVVTSRRDPGLDAFGRSAAIEKNQSREAFEI